MSTPAYFAPVAAATAKTIALTMQRLWLTGQVLPAGARLTVQHIFRSDENKPLEVIYAFSLPRDAALRRFRITGDGFEVESDLRETESAVKAYEEGIAQGSLAALARQHGDGVINLTVGNIRPQETVTVHLEILAGVELRDDGFRFRFPFTLAPAYHSRAKAAKVSTGEGEIELPAAEFGDVILPPFHKDASRLHQVGFDLQVRTELELSDLASPSHGVRVTRDSGMCSRVALATEKDIPNRDLVLDVRYQKIAPQILAGRDGGGKCRFAAIVPSSSFGENPNTARRVVILLDRSGSMEGVPLAQASKAIMACMAALDANDLFGLVAFDDRTETFLPTLVPGTRENRDKAQRFLGQVNARGGTELAAGVLEAVKLLEGQSGDILILTDGQVAGTEEILAKVRATGSRLHCLGIGSASQDRFLSLLARETGGVSRFVTPSERVDLPAVDLFASIGRPVASGLKSDADIQPAPPAAVFSGTPVLLFGALDDGGDHTLGLTWDGGGKLSLPVALSDGEVGDTVWLLQGSRLITDWESRYPSDEALATLEKRKLNRAAARIRDLSMTYGLASREMSLVAVVKRAGDRPGELPDTKVVPVGMPQDTEFGAYFGAMVAGATGAFPAAQLPLAAYRVALPPPKAPGVRFHRLFRLGKRAAAETPPPAQTSEDFLLELTSRLESDGGMPGKNTEARAGASIVAMFAFLSSRPFRSHVARLVAFLKSVRGLPPDRQRLLEAALGWAAKGAAPPGDWIKAAESSKNPWKALAQVVEV